jgi:hypothetical protein
MNTIVCYQVYFSTIIRLQLTEAHTDASRSNKDQLLLNLCFIPNQRNRRTIAFDMNIASVERGRNSVNRLVKCTIK